jgi:hypothetical protein
VRSATEAVEALYFTIKGVPNLSNLFAELYIPDAGALDKNVISLVEKFGASCVPIRQSIERLSQSSNPVFQYRTEDTASIVGELRLYIASIVIGGLQHLKSILRYAYLDKSMR